MKPRVHIVDYGMGNLRSVANAVDVAGGASQLASVPTDLATATHVILPGVGAFGDGMRALREGGWVEALDDLVVGKGTRCMGICLGMQLMAGTGTEHGRHDGLGWLAGTVERLPGGPEVRVPHVGWNTTIRERECQLWADLPDHVDSYYVHSFALVPDAPDQVVGTCDHGGRFTSMVHAGNICAVQFHPEKSHDGGLRMLQSFLTLDVDAPC